jgi:cytochrome c peroxidase
MRSLFRPKNVCLLLAVAFALALLSGFRMAAPQANWPLPKKMTAAQLGKQLFHEKILSLDSTVSCASCHQPALAFADTSRFSIGIGGQPTSRNTPSVLNMKNRPYFYWDGRAASLEQQSLMPIQHPKEMALPIALAIERLNQNKTYTIYFKNVFGAAPNAKNLSKAFAAFEKTLETDNSLFDDWSNGQASKKWTAQMERGRVLFLSDKTQCFNCHKMEDFTTDEFENIGLFNGKNLNDSGRYKVTKARADIGRFKIPGLRNVAVTAPYMHNGQLKTLAEVVDYYCNPDQFVPDASNRSPRMADKIDLSKQEKADLIAFLETLTDRAYLKQK